MGKQELIGEVVGRLRERLGRMLAAGRSAEAYAKDEESRPEDKYDTRSLEASYLAAGQARQVEELAGAVRLLENWTPPGLGEGDRIRLGALVEAEVEGEIAFYLLAPAGGGTSLTYLGCDLLVLTMDSPLAQRLSGRRAGDVLEREALTILGVE